MMAKVPLAGHAGGISLPFEELGEGRLAVGDPVLGVGPECAVDAEPVGVAAGQQGRARGRTDRQTFFSVYFDCIRRLTSLKLKSLNIDLK